jgi:hypothetical protein
MLATAGTPTTWQGANISGDPTTKGTPVAEEISTAVQTAATADNLEEVNYSKNNRTSGDANYRKALELMETPVVGMLTTAGTPTTARDHNNSWNPRNVNGSNNIANCRVTATAEATGASWATTSTKTLATTV